MAHVGELLVSGVGRAGKKAGASCRLICFNWAGGGAAHYIRWARDFSDEIEVLAVRLPGREVRLREQPYTDAASLARDVANLVKDQYSDKPFAFFGHSFGSHTSLAVSHYLKVHHQMEPVHLFVSGAYPLFTEAGQQVLQSRLPPSQDDDAFIEYLKRLGGTPPEIMENKEVLKFFLPPLKADVKVMQGYKPDFGDEPPLSCPVTAFSGKEDEPAASMLEGWKAVTSGPYNQHILSGKHFYLLEPQNASKLRELIEWELDKSSCTPL